MLPQIRHIHKFVVDEQSAHVDIDAGDASANGMERERDPEVVGWDESKVCEYLQTGHRLSPHLLRHMQ